MNSAAVDEDEDSSPEWNTIKNWVGSQEPVKKHPISQLIERETRKGKGFDEGGEVGDPMADPLLQPRGSGIIAPSPVAPAPAAVAPPMAPKAPISTPPPAAAMPPPPPMSAPSPAPSGASYSSEAAKVLGTTPEELKAYLTKTMTPDSAEMIGRAGSTIGDALSRAGGSNSNYLEQFNAQKQKEKENLAGIPEKVAGAGKEKYGLEHELETFDPKSPFSKVMQGSNSQLLKSMGASDADIASMPAAAINDVIGHQVTLQDALARIKQEGTYQRGMLGIQGEAQKTRRAEAGTRQKEAEKGALEKIAGGSPVPFVGPSHEEKQAAIKKLGELGGIGKGGGPEGPLGQETVKDGKTYVWSPTTGAYHLKNSNE